ncbi:LETM1-related biofilm-associated protein [Robiginitalea sp. SC105]|uniref:LETM1-related biofilm-associated protein n=1 Tax=Robiginitalea sp. SC105 TaxID=2762332 RepID=UPI001639B33F|nr:hypothetical protein [Robiginitalea sp. SC105]
MNPSSSGWIDKFGYLAAKKSEPFGNFGELYEALRKLGFSYGMNIAIPSFIKPTHELTQDENAKLNLLYGLYATYQLRNQKVRFPHFLESVFNFYKDLEVGRIGFLQKILTGKKTSTQLEKLMDSRIYLEANMLSKTFNSIITNSLLFVDVLTYKHYLDGHQDLRPYARNLEFVTINITSEALGSKKKNPTDERLRELFRSSITFMEDPDAEPDLGYRDLLGGYRGTGAARYFLDVACLTVWEDGKLEYQESDFVYRLGEDLGLEKDYIRTALDEVTLFYSQHATELSVLHDGRFYDGMTKVVNKLIRRNSKRLQNELSQSRELMYLLSKSTIRELTDEEKAKVQEQLVDIFKSIPSLAIFLLPGGAVLLPMFISLVPRLLPSSFDENRVDPKEE